MLPTVFHITHQKAGSQWVAEVLKYCAPDRIVLPKDEEAHFRTDSLKRGRVYLTVYVSKPDFDAVIHATPDFARHPLICFVIIRDLRDALVSAYFSYKNSHPILAEKHRRRRQMLRRMDQEQGMLYMMDEVLTGYAAIQTSWMNSQALLIRYEEILADEYTLFERMIAYCQIDIEPRRLHTIITNNSFRMISGRNRGQEDVMSHQRKGIAGDWRNHFTPRIRDRFKQQYGDVLIKTGYEHDDSW